MKAKKKKQNILAKTINSTVGLLDKIKMDEDIRKTKKKALRILLYALTTLAISYSICRSLINFGIIENPSNNLLIDILGYVGVISVFTIAISFLVVLGSKRCEKCFPERRSTSILDGNNPAGPNYPGRHYTDSNMVSYTNRYHR